MNAKLFSVLILFLAVLYLSNPDEDTHRRAVAKFIQDHCQVEDDSEVWQLVIDGLYYKNFLFFSTCIWNNDTLLSQGGLFKASVIDDEQRRKILFESFSTLNDRNKRSKEDWHFDNAYTSDP